MSRNIVLRDPSAARNIVLSSSAPVVDLEPARLELVAGAERLTLTAGPDRLVLGAGPRRLILEVE